MIPHRMRSLGNPRRTFTLVTLALATLSILTGRWIDSPLLFWLGVAINCVGIGLLYEE